jgi:hypothetical protein
MLKFLSVWKTQKAALLLDRERRDNHRSSRPVVAK